MEGGREGMRGRVKGMKMDRKTRERPEEREGGRGGERKGGGRERERVFNIPQLNHRLLSTMYTADSQTTL